MNHFVGQTLVHPHHGPVEVTEIRERAVGRTKRTYLGLSVRDTDLQIAVPLDMAEEIGIREVIGTVELQELFDTLHAESDPQEAAWSRRFKANRDLLRLGELRSTAGVVRDLGRRFGEKGLSMGEREMLAEARKPLVGEIVVAMGISKEEAEALIDQAVTGERVDVALLAQAS